MGASGCITYAILRNGFIMHPIIFTTTKVEDLLLRCETYATVFWLRPLPLWSRGSFFSGNYKQNHIFLKCWLNFETFKEKSLGQTWQVTAGLPTSKQSPGVLLTCASSAVQGDDLISADSSFTHWTHLSVGSGLQPLQKKKRNHLKYGKVCSKNVSSLAFEKQRFLHLT